MVGTTLGHYRIDGLLGRGGMGEVYRARDTRLGRAVAVKVMAPRGADQASIVERFLREARAASALNHPNIVTIHEIGQTDEGVYYLVQELVEGRTLRDLLGDGLPADTAGTLTRQLARALAAAHDAGIVHRDVKPENVMVRPDGYLKVLDFGVARILPGQAASDEMTRAPEVTEPGLLLGTTGYMSPEQAGGRAAGPPSDVFALGVLLYEMLTGRRPFTGPSSLQVLQAILNEHPPAPSRINPAVPAAFDPLVSAMLAKEPGGRPTATDVDARLEQLLASPVRRLTPAPSAPRKVVGRDAERERLLAELEAVTAGSGRLVAVTGEPGIGKTTLVEDALAAMATSPLQPVIARGRCSERLAGSEAYLPLLELLDNLLHGGTGGSFGEMIRTLAPAWYVHLAPAASERAAVADATGAHGPVSQERMKRELAALLVDIARVRPLVLLIEDLHWADVSTVDLLNYLAGRFEPMRVLVLVTYRPSDMAVARHPFLHVRQELETRGVFRELALEFLTAADVDRFLGMEFPGHDLPPALGRVLHDRTEGSPLFMVDLVRDLRDRQVVVRRNDRWELATSVRAVARDLPETVRGMIARKIERLDDTDRRLLTAASVQGHEFDTAVVSDALGLDPAEVEERCETLDRVHRLVQAVRTYDLPDRTLCVRYRFVHVLYQNVLYAALQPTRRVALAARVARALVTHHGEESAALASELALLFETARDFAAAARQFHLAAQHAIGLFGFQEARALAQRGLDALVALPDGPARKQQELGLQMVKGVALRSSTGWATPELEQTFTRARALCQALGDPPAVFPVLWAITLFHLIRGNLVECRTRADQLMEQATPSGDPALMMAAHHMAGVSREFLGDMVEATRYLERARELHDPAQHQAYTAMYGMDPGMIARAMSSRPLWALGYPGRARARGLETLALARSQQQPVTLVFALMVLLGILAYRGDGAEALAIGDENIALCREHGLPQEAEWSRSFQGAALIGLGRTQDGIDLLRDSLAVQHALDTRLARPMFLALLAEGFCREGRIDEGRRAVDEGLLYAEQIAEGGYVAELYRVGGELARRAGEAAAAEDLLRRALARANGQQARSLELRAATGLATLLAASGRVPEARNVLAPVYGWFTEGFDTADLVAARATL
ncbi:MAG: protein kinase, partial [Acidobacteriota bacterium]|nr:protein kinase [Acidobacteriota bacterium]